MRAAHATRSSRHLVLHALSPPAPLTRPPQLKSALLVLLQHNFAVAYVQRDPPTLRSEGQAYTLYRAAPDRILQSLRCVCA